MTHFNVLTEPWLTAVSHDGTEREYSLLDLLAHAHELKMVVDPAPPIQFGLYRLLIAFVQHALRLQEIEDLEDALDLGKFDASVFEAYAKEIGWHRFDLFDPQRPFMQSGPFADDLKHTDSVAKLFYHLPKGSNKIHFVHLQEHEHAVAPAVAARALCSIAAFEMSGGQGYSPSLNGAPPWYVLAVGRNLFETILLNCCVMDIPGLNHDAPPAWASDEPILPKEEKSVGSIVEGLTWQPRRVRLLPSDGGVCTYSGRESTILVRKVVWWYGFKVSDPDGWLDPHVAYVYDEKNGRQALRPEEGKQLWCDYGALFLLRDQKLRTKTYSRPAVVNQLLLLKDERVISEDIAEQFEVYGMRTRKGQAKIFEWQYDRMPLKTAVLKNPEAGVQVQHAIQLAQDVAKALASALQAQHPEGERERSKKSSGRRPKTRERGNRLPNEKALGSLIHRAQSEFWILLEPIFHSEFLRQLGEQRVGDQEARQALLSEWKSTLREIAWRCFDKVSWSVGVGADALRRQVIARSAFAAALSMVLKETAKVRGGKGEKSGGE